MFRLLVAIALCIALPMLAMAQQETGHYPAGAEGLKAATLPGPGTYLKWYHIFYSADTLKDSNGRDVPVDLDLDVLASVPRLIHMTEHKFFGADYGMDIAIPFVSVDLKVGATGINDSKFGLGDILFEPVLLGWHHDRLDIGVAAAVWCPTGEFDSNNAVNVGKGFWTGMLTAGATYYFDDEKTWHISALGRYELHTKKSDIDIKPGDDFHIEWGLGHDFAPGWSAGVTAYTQWQITNDSGSDANYAKVRDRFFSVGPELLYFHEPAKTFISARYQREFGARDRTEGHNTIISFVKIF